MLAKTKQRRLIFQAALLLKSSGRLPALAFSV